MPPHPWNEPDYNRVKGMLQGSPVLCAHCQREQATELDHDPPLAMHKHRQGSGCCRWIPSCKPCNREGGKLVHNGRWRPGTETTPIDEEPPERDGLEPGDRRWRKPWLADLRKPPADATWPRLMTVPHPAAVGTLGPEFTAWAEDRSQRPLRWWQRLVAARLLEVDPNGRLVWQACLLSMSRQLGKSWLLRELCLWRIHQGSRFGEPQDVLHTGKDLAVCKEVQRPARLWAKAHKDVYRVREVNGQEEIEVLADGSRWMLRAKEAVYGYSVSMAAADEAWKVRESSIEEGLTPTMVDRNQAQLLLISTAHRAATSLMLGRRQAALASLETGDGDLLIEWSTPAGVDLEDVDGWRAASPHWTPQRQRLIEQQLAKMRAGEVDDPEEPDPVKSFEAQWLNRWPRRRVPVAARDTEPLLPEGVWAGLLSEGLASSGPVWLAVEDDVGYGAAVAAATLLDDGRLEVDGWLCADWDTAMTDVAAVAALRPVKTLLVGASLKDRVPTMAGLPSAGLAGSRETKVGLPILRDLAVAGRLAHDTSADLDQAFGLARVRETPTGLALIAAGPIHLIKALVWAVTAATKPAKTPAIH